MTQHLRWGARPELHEPVLIAAFDGWNDAGEAATATVKTLAEQWLAVEFADIDPEEFFDFTANRPHVRLVGDGTRVIDWPSNRFLHATVPSAGTDVVFLLGTEPGLRWRAFCDQILTVVRDTGARMVVTLGALLADVPHTRAPHVIGTADDDALVRRLRLRRSRYEGPTGIVGALHDACRADSIPSAALWVAVPTYVSGPASPVAALALVRRVTELLGVPVSTVELEREAADYTRRIDELVADDEDLQSYLHRLEEAHDEDPGDDEPADPDALIEEVERFLREQQ